MIHTEMSSTSLYCTSSSLEAESAFSSSAAILLTEAVAATDADLHSMNKSMNFYRKVT